MTVLVAMSGKGGGHALKRPQLPAGVRLGDTAQAFTGGQRQRDMQSSPHPPRRLRKTKTPHVVFLLDVDNTLLDNDRVTADLRRYLTREVGPVCQRQYWTMFEHLRADLGYADYLGALQRYRIDHPHDHHLFALSSYLMHYPFAHRLYPQSLEVVARCRAWGTPVILSDGDVVFQPRKIERSGLYAAVEQHVLIYVHKEQELDEVARRYPADHYVWVDDKLRILTAVKQAWGPRVTTVFPRQGHYARDPGLLAAFPAADISVDRIGELLAYDLRELVSAGQQHTDKAGKRKARVGSRLTRKTNAR